MELQARGSGGHGNVIREELQLRGILRIEQYCKGRRLRCDLLHDFELLEGKLGPEHSHARHVASRLPEGRHEPATNRIGDVDH